MRRHPHDENGSAHSMRTLVLDTAGGIALFVLLFAVLHLPVVT